jgi:hypothetical protein
MRGFDRKFLILVAALPIGMLLGLLIGLVVGFIWPVHYTGVDVVDLRAEDKEDYIVMVAAAYALDGDVARAEKRLSRLNVPNPAQLVSALADRYIEEGRDPAEIERLVRLADALGVSTESMLREIGAITPTPTSTPTQPPMNTPEPTATPTSTPVPTATSLPTATPLPTDTPPKPTPKPRPPTATPTPAPPTEAPTPANEFRIENQRRFSEGENGGCTGMHTIFITVRDLAGNPLNGVVVGDPWGNVEEVTGKKGPGKTEIDLWKNTMQILVKRDASGKTVTSEVGMPMSSRTPEISDEDLIAAGYCADASDCATMRSLDPYRCHGHFSYEIIFRRTW